MNTRVHFEDGKYGVRAVLNSAWDDSMLPELLTNGVQELELNLAKGWRGTDLSFLEKLPHLAAFSVLDLGTYSIEPIHSLHELKSLKLVSYSKTLLDFSAFPTLKECSLEWNRESPSLFDCTSLRTLFLNRYGGKDMSALVKLTLLESLSILNSPISELRGICGLRNLCRLRLGNLRKLRSLSGIESLRELRELDMNTCRSIGSLTPVSALQGLEKLFFNNCGRIESLQPLANLSALREVIFYESTDVVDGDLSPLTRLPNLTNLSFQNRRHYSHRREQFTAYTDN